jgi:adenylosuccinate synthase
MFGSCGKGHLAAQLAYRTEASLVVRTGGPNAGHTVLGEPIVDGHLITFKLRCLPTAAVSRPRAVLALAAGSVVDPVVLADEIALLQRFGRPDLRVLVDPAATILEPHHIQWEHDGRTHLGRNLEGWSTQKGIGAARVDRLQRTAKTAQDWDWSEFGDAVRIANVGGLVRQDLRSGRNVVIETAQGYGLGLHTEYYPKTTSSDCRAIDALADVGYSPWVGRYAGASPSGRDMPQVWIALRPFPIRVAGDSGPLLGETTWEALGLAPEYTTVTQKVRRVGAWDQELVHAAILANGGPAYNVQAVLMMADQIQPGIENTTDQDQWPEEYDELTDYIDKINEAGARVTAVGTGPDTMVFFVGADL